MARQASLKALTQRGEVTEVRLDEHKDETHESWVLIRVGRVSSTPGARLFDSEIQHQHYMAITVTRCSRKRDLHRDWLHGEPQPLLELNLSEAQWATFVSSPNQGSGVPATLTFLTGIGRIAQAPPESRMAESLKEVREAGEKALEQVQDRFEVLLAAFETGGRKAQREALSSLGNSLTNAPRNMEFAGESLVGHIEEVVTRAQSDIENMVRDAAENNGIADVSQLLLGRTTNEPD